MNGFATYDRKTIKFDLPTVSASNKRVIEAGNQPTKVATLAPTSERNAQSYKFVTEKPTDGWEKPGFADSAWKTAPGGFGSGQTGATVNTEWTTPDIWLRRTVKLDKKPGESVFVRIAHDEDVEVFVNGVLAATAKGFINGYNELPLNAEGRAALKSGDNLIAVHCKQTQGGQAIDIGLGEYLLVK